MAKMTQEQRMENAMRRHDEAVMELFVGIENFAAKSRATWNDWNDRTNMLRLARRYSAAVRSLARSARA